MTKGICIKLTSDQRKVLAKMSNVYGATMEERLLHVVVDVLAEEKRRQDALAIFASAKTPKPSHSRYDTGAATRVFC